MEAPLAHRRQHPLRALVVVIASGVVLFGCMGIYLHLNPLNWPGSGFTPYLPAHSTSGLHQLGVRVQPMEKVPLRMWLPPKSTSLYFSFSRYRVEEDADWGMLSTTNITQDGQQYELSYADRGSGPTAISRKGKTTIELRFGTAPITTSELDAVIDSFVPTHLWKIPVQYDTYNGTV